MLSNVSVQASLYLKSNCAARSTKRIYKKHLKIDLFSKFFFTRSTAAQITSSMILYTLFYLNNHSLKSTIKFGNILLNIYLKRSYVMLEDLQETSSIDTISQKEAFLYILHSHLEQLIALMPIFNRRILAQLLSFEQQIIH